MISRCPDRFHAVLVLLCVVVAIAHAIYDPREATTKPPKRRESILPWFSLSKVDSSEDLTRSPKWTDPDSPVTRKPYAAETGTSEWGPWRKERGSQLEQRTMVPDDSQSTRDFEQHGDLEYSQFEQQENRKLPPDPAVPGDLQENENIKGRKEKPPGRNDLQTDRWDDQDYYEGIPADSTKPRKEKLHFPKEQKYTVARYDAKSGVQCPRFDSTGQFVYPPDCKFFVNCWKGRAFVQPCAPGTLFNPATLECDFPHKVQCYGGEVADFPSNLHLEPSGRREPLMPGHRQGNMQNERLKEPRCPPFVTGLVAHPSDCTKFLQCANGGTFVMDCGPGTVFNPAISVCDWPNNVRGCEDALKSEEEVTTPLIPPDYEEFGNIGRLHHVKHEHQPAKKITCPAFYTGLLPHPETCTKFLQCANGGTFIMDCGPGTAFNPLISVCDWPYNVPSCKKDKPQNKQPSVVPVTTLRPWPTESNLWHQPNHTSQDHYRPTYNPYANHPVSTTTHPEPNWDFLRPTWRPSWISPHWTTPSPQTNQRTEPNTNYGSPDDQQQHHHKWHQTPGTRYPGPSQWPHNHGTDQDSNYDGRYYHHHHHFHHANGHAHDSNKNTETQQPAPPYGQTHPQAPGQGTDEGHRFHYHGTHHEHWHSGDSGQQTQQPAFDKTEDGSLGPPDLQQPDQESGGGTWSTNVGGHQDPNLHLHGNSNKLPSGPDLRSEDPGQETQQPSFEPTDEQENTSDGRIVFPQNNNGGLGGDNIALNGRGGRTGQMFPSSSSTNDRRNYTRSGDENRQTVQNRTRSIDPLTGYTLNTWNQLGPNYMQPQNRRWNQGTVNEDDKFREWESRTNIYQSTANREADSKLNQWTLRTNGSQYGKGQRRPGVKTATFNVSRPVYQNGVYYVNMNGTRGYFITKELEVNQNHSQTRFYRPNALPESNKFNRNGQTVYLNFTTTNSSRTLPTVIQPVFYIPNNRPFRYNNTSQSKDISFHGHNHRAPKYHWTINSTSKNPDLRESGSGYQNVYVPLISPRPPVPYPSFNKSYLFPFMMEANFSRGNSYYPPVPSTNLEPPYIEPPRANTHPIGWQYPIPSVVLQPPLMEVENSPRNSSNYSSTSNFQSLSQLTPPTFTWNVTNQYPKVPSTSLEPPFEEYNNPLDNSSRPSTTQRTLENVVTDPPEGETVKPVKRSENASTTTTTNPTTTSTTTTNPTTTSTTTTNPATTNTITTTDPNVPTVWIEDVSSSTIKYTEDVDPDSEVDVMVKKEEWKPVLVFENKTRINAQNGKRREQDRTTTETSIMKINKKKTDVELLNIDAPPFEEEEPPFPSYYVPPVEPINRSKKDRLPTPVSGQVVRLRGGFGPHDGYVEVQGVNPGWGVVCDRKNSWTLKEAHVVCKQLGYAGGAEMAWQGRNTRNGVPTWIAANSVSCQGNEAKFQTCKFTHEQQCRVERDAIGVRCVLNRFAHCRKDEIPYEGQCYHLADPESGLNHAEALDYCSRRQSRLIDIISQGENDFISEWLVQTQPEVASIMTSGVGFTTMGRTMWLWEDSSKAKFRFAKWWPGWMEDKKHPPFVGSRPLCLVMKRKFPCHERPDSICVADYFFWDTEDCASSGKGHSYICKRPYNDIGCTYGKGSQYAGTANVTSSGKDCLSWGDPEVAQPLSVKVRNREVREKLQTHNYCRNPDPNRDIRPWCFTGPRGEREYCDIPPCGNLGSQRSRSTGQCKPKHFECMPGECIPSPWVCDGEEDCTNGADERTCISQMDLFQKHAKHKLEGHDVQKWLNTPLETCALRCKDADFTCRSFSHTTVGNVCLLSDSNVGMTGSLKPNKQFDYYEMKEMSINCDGMFVCENQKCINQTQVCNGKNDCNDRSDEKICTAKNLDYDIRLAGSDNKHEGRIEVKILGVWGQVCDDGFGMIDADVICKELGFKLGALEISPGGYFGNMDPPTTFMVDQLKCRGNETSLRECDFEGWGVHDCQPEEAVGVVCKTAANSCQDGHWKCDKHPLCIPIAFICDEVVDCPDGSDESSKHCDAPFEVRLANGSSPFEGRVEVRHHGIWGTVCDDDFSNAIAGVICRSLGYGGHAIAKKDGYFGPGEGPIWLDEVICVGNETQLNRCEHDHWGQHNCNHDEDAGVICTPGDVNNSKIWETVSHLPAININDILPANCGRRFKDFNEDEDLIFQKVVRGSIAPKGSYPWQASIRVRTHSRSNHWCGAVVLTPLHVLTAAHCLEGYKKGTYFVRAGDYNTEIEEGTEAEANIEDYYIHEDFRKGHRMNNDIALVLLKGRGISLGKDVMPICLPTEDTEYVAGLNCTISGFGSVETGQSTHAKDLRYGWVPLLDQSVCRAEYVYGAGAISDGMFCAGYLDEGVDTCDGDSGGPLACLHNGAFTLYGLTSWGQRCGRANKPGVYVRVSHYRQWIDQKIKESLGGR
ncbi:uncharacterized protein LOC143433270 [Xylocopa sonorina]|uniref:uncharacterized protein LOC143433270 n=1 Tax=Xylocopa sonorina TaxID=1818115 RepID=UPI00403AE21D